jgi:hypothetical protein
MRTELLPHEQAEPWASSQGMKDRLRERFPAELITAANIAEFMGLPVGQVRQFFNSKALRGRVAHLGKSKYCHRDDWAVFWVEIRPNEKGARGRNGRG